MRVKKSWEERPVDKHKHTSSDVFLAAFSFNQVLRFSDSITSADGFRQLVKLAQTFRVRNSFLSSERGAGEAQRDADGKMSGEVKKLHEGLVLMQRKPPQAVHILSPSSENKDIRSQSSGWTS